LPEVSWLFFKARAKHSYLSHTGRASNAEKQQTGPGPEGCDENGPAAALLVGHVSIQICFLLAPCRRPILIATICLLFRGQDTIIQGGRGDAVGELLHSRADALVGTRSCAIRRGVSINANKCLSEEVRSCRSSGVAE
jgi:hypothetical protein